jgi:hypothetical protein
MNLIQVEILSGLHKGASWEFTSGEISIGGSPNCSVFLCDEHLPDQCLHLKMIGNRVSLIYLDSEMGGIEDLISRVGKWIYPDQFYTFNSKGIEFSVSIKDVSGDVWSRLGNVAARLLGNVADTVQAMGVRLVVGISLGLGVLSTVTLLFLGSGTGVLNAAQKPRVDYYDPAKIGTNPSDTQLAVPVTAEESVLNELLEFSKTYSATYNEATAKDGSVKVQAQMNRAQLSNFEKLLQKLVLDYGDKVSVQASIQLSPEQKIVDQIVVQSVMLGEQPVVTLENGERLFVGAFYENLRLQQVTPNGLVLVGESTYRVPL